MSRMQLGVVVRQLHHLAALPVQDVSDGQLLERFSSAGEEAAFEALLRRHGPMVHALCRRILHDPHAAEDAFQATFLVLLRRAGDLDRRRSLAGWLYTVAYHVALRARSGAARRRRKEEAVRPPPHPEPDADILWRDLRPVLDEELQRLPEEMRLPLVLCYLEGRTNEEAGRQLGWPVGTVKSRLARARELLRHRLARRGITLAACLSTEALGTAVAAVPAALTRHTLALALQNAPTSAVVALAEGALTTMSLVKVKMAAAFLLFASLAALGLCAFAAPAEAQRRGPALAGVEPAAPVVADPPPAPDKVVAPMDALTVSGQVLGGDGKPLPGARVALLAGRAQPGSPLPAVLAEVRTDAAGKFRLRARRLNKGAGAEVVLAWAPGHGPVWQHPPAKGKELELRLPPETALRGRLIDLQGQPAAGVKLEAVRLGPRSAEGGWVVYHKANGKAEGAGNAPITAQSAKNAVRVRIGGMPEAPPVKVAAPPPGPTVVCHKPPVHLPGWPATVTTDREGRFVLRGVGKGQAVGLRITDERFALQVLDFTPDGKDAEVTRVLAPVRVLEGTITDADTAQPVPNARVQIDAPGSYGGVGFRLAAAGLDETDARGRRGMGWGSRFRGAFLLLYNQEISGHELPPLEALTDAHGRFRFHLYPDSSYRLRVDGPAGKQYLPRSASARWPGGAVVRQHLDLKLQRGAVLRGRVTEAPGEKPLAEARVDFWSKGLKLPPGTRQPAEVTTRKDGTFEALLPPGNWHLLINGKEPTYAPQKIAIDQLTEEQPPPPAKGEPAARRHFYPAAWTAVELKPGVERDVKVNLRRAGLLRGRVVGPDGKPVTGVYLIRRPAVPLEPTVYPKDTARPVRYEVRPDEKRADRLVLQFWLGDRPPREELMPVELRDGSFSIAVHDPEATYRLCFVAASGQQGAVVELSGKQAGGEPVTVRLQPCGQATARFVDGQGKALAGYRPLLWLLQPPGPHAAPTDLSDALNHRLRTHNAVWAAYLDMARHGDGPRSAAAGRVTLPTLIPGATYRVFLGAGKTHDFTVAAGRTAELGDLTVEAAATTLKLPVVRPGK